MTYMILQNKITISIFKTAKKKDIPFKIDNYSTDTAYEAYNDDGYCVELWYNDSGKYMSVEVTTPTPISDLEWG